jgi:hypothetical protein
MLKRNITMKNYKLKLLTISLLLLAIILYACQEDFLEKEPIGSLSENQVASEKGVEAILIGAYAMLDGNIYGTNWQASGSNWVYGSVASDDAYKGSDPGDQAPINPIERLEATASNSFFNIKWRALYEGIARANNTLRVMELVEDMPEATKTRIEAEARFLRGHYHFDAKKMWNNVPFVDESITLEAEQYKVPNDRDIWPDIEADFKFAFDNLESSGMAAGRANKWAAAAYLAKAYMFQEKFAQAKSLLDDIIANGVTPAGVKYDLLETYDKNFNAEFKNGSESVFAIQSSVNDGGGGANANFDLILNFPHNTGPGGCCGFFQPTQDLVNAHRTDNNGLPMPDNYNSQPVKNDAALGSDDPFTPDQGNLDPRLDWSVGRRGIPYLDWGPHPGREWIRYISHGGPYSPKKNVFYKSQQGTLTDISYWSPGLSAINYNLIRYADVLLWAAEAEAELGNLDQAQEYVNMIRRRAANPEGFVEDENGDPAANYVIDEYTTPFASKEAALEAIYFEKRLEFAMEGHRFFDLVRWEIADETMDSFFTFESQFRSHLAGAEFDAGQDEYFPIPLRQIDLHSQGGVSTLTQNPGHN